MDNSGCIFEEVSLSGNLSILVSSFKLVNLQNHVTFDNFWTSNDHANGDVI